MRVALGSSSCLLYYWIQGCLLMPLASGISTRGAISMAILVTARWKAESMHTSTPTGLHKIVNDESIQGHARTRPFLFLHKQETPNCGANKSDTPTCPFGVLARLILLLCQTVIEFTVLIFNAILTLHLGTSLFRCDHLVI